MYGLTRGPVTLIAAGVAGFLIWISATQINDHNTGGYWAVYGIIAGAGLVMALSQLLGGWTKWGLPRIDPGVFLLAFIPTLIAVAWIAVAGQPHGNTLRSHVLSWSGDLGITGAVKHLIEYLSVLTFGLGLVFGFTFDTTGPKPRPAPAPVVPDRQATTVPPAPVHDGARAPARSPERERVPVGAAPRSTDGSDNP
jgi:hypothetical protein